MLSIKPTQNEQATFFELNVCVCLQHSQCMKVHVCAYCLYSFRLKARRHFYNHMVKTICNPIWKKIIIKDWFAAGPLLYSPQPLVI